VCPRSDLKNGQEKNPILILNPIRILYSFSQKSQKTMSVAVVPSSHLTNTTINIKKRDRNDNGDILLVKDDFVFAKPSAPVFIKRFSTCRHQISYAAKLDNCSCVVCRVCTEKCGDCGKTLCREHDQPHIESQCASDECQAIYCNDCNECESCFRQCDACNSSYCEGKGCADNCLDICYQCGVAVCDDCLETDPAYIDPYVTCAGCEIIMCPQCADKEFQVAEDDDVLLCYSCYADDQDSAGEVANKVKEIFY